MYRGGPSSGSGVTMTKLAAGAVTSKSSFSVLLPLLPFPPLNEPVLVGRGASGSSVVAVFNLREVCWVVGCADSDDDDSSAAGLNVNYETGKNG